MKSVEQLSGEVAEILEISIPRGLSEQVKQTSVRYDRYRDLTLGQSSGLDNLCSNFCPCVSWEG